VDRKAERHCERILKLAREHFTNIQVETYDVSEQVAILIFRCRLGQKQIAVTEILLPDRRKYSYYLLEGETVLLGLDNARDRLALRKKYGDAFVEHLDEFVPHLHREGNRVLELTDEKHFPDFVQMAMRFEE